MTLQQLKNEIEERFEKKFRNPANLKEGIFWGWSSQDMNGYEQIKSFLLSEIEKAYQAGREEALEELMKETKEKRQIEVEKMEKSSLVVDRMYHKGWIHAIDFFDEIVQFKKLKVNK